MVGGTLGWKQIGGTSLWEMFSACFTRFCGVFVQLELRASCFQLLAPAGPAKLCPPTLFFFLASWKQGLFGSDGDQKEAKRSELQVFWVVLSLCCS